MYFLRALFFSAGTLPQAQGILQGLILINLLLAYFKGSCPFQGLFLRVPILFQGPFQRENLGKIRVRGPERRYGPSRDRIVVVVVVVVVVVLGFLLRSINYNKEAPAATTPL